MIVTVIDRKAMASDWGSGPFAIITRRVEIPDTCPKCGGPRGTATLRTVQVYEDGEVAHPHIWENPCGHRDLYSDILVDPTTVFLDS